MEIVKEAALSSFFEALFDKLAPFDLLNFMRQERVNDEIEKWKKMMQRIRAVMEDAEEKQITSELVKIWLKDLTDLTYDVDDILDEFATEVLRRKLNAEAESEPQPRPSKVRKTLISAVTRLIPRAVTDLIPSAFTGWSPIVVTFNMKMGSQIKEITARFEKIVKETNDLDLREFAGGRTDRPRATRLLTTSLVTEAHVYGRDEDKEAIAKLLLSDEWSDAQHPVITICGMGGVGKTTLAQLVYNDKEVNAKFDLKAWVCVSDEFDIFRVTKAALESFTSDRCKGRELDKLQVKLKEELSGKKFLLILDDVWNENYDDWTKLRCPFEGGARGSKIVVTTRNKDVALTMGTIEAYTLKELPNEDCLCIFTQHALGMRNFSAHPELEVTGREILKKCKGLPLAAKTLGGLLRTKKSHDEWKYVLDSKIWEIPAEKCGIIPALRLSYQHLPSHLKRCFAYCSIFPKDYEFEKKELVLLWMAEGLVQQPKGNKQMEDLGSEYFHDLYSRSFFQQSSSNNSCFVMHDLINDMAQWVAEDLCFRLEDESGVFKQSKIPAKARHSSYFRSNFDSIAKFEAFYKVKGLRTFLSLSGEYVCYLNNNVIFDLLPQLNCLRVLSLSEYGVVKLPDSIGDLKHLRYLNLSSTMIISLPESTSCLFNLQTLILKDCSRLTKLPNKIGSLINLRHLDITRVDSIKEMPVGMKELKSLQTLSNFVVGKDTGSMIGDLMNLDFLRETLSISGLENVIKAQDARNANLNGKKNLDALLLKWGSELDDSQDERVAIDVLEMLRPHITLKELTIKCYAGAKFPTWLGNPSFSFMVILKIESCGKCTSLPPLGQLPSLKDISIRKMPGVKSVGFEFYGNGSLKPFQSLDRLCFEEMQEWQDWIPHGEFHCLRELSISQCPKLRGKLPNLFPSLEEIFIDGCEQLVVSISNFPMLCNFEFNRCKVVAHGSIDGSSSLNYVSLNAISELKSLTEGFMHGIGKAKYLEINNCEELTSLWQDKDKVGNSSIASEQEENEQLEVPCTLEKLPQALHSLTSLEKLKIVNCPRLISFSDNGLPSMLRELITENCESLEKLPQVMHNLTSLGKLEIRVCPRLISFPNTGLPSMLRELIIENCESLEKLPQVMHNLTSLGKLEIRVCPRLISFPNTGLPSMLRELIIQDCKSLEKLSHALHNLTSLGKLTIERCPRLNSFLDAGLPLTLRELIVDSCGALNSLLHETNMCNKTAFLERLIIEGCESLTFIIKGQLPPTLKRLEIYNCKNLQCVVDEGEGEGDGEGSPSSLSINNNASLLEYLCIMNCPSFKFFSSTGEKGDLPAALEHLQISGWRELTSLSLPAALKFLRIGNCPMLESIVGERLDNNSSLERLEIWNCEKLKSLSKGLHNLCHLNHIELSKCPSLVSFLNELLPTTLRVLKVVDCRNLEAALPNPMYNLTSLQLLGLDCDRGIYKSFLEKDFPTSLIKLDISIVNICKPLLEEGLYGLTSLRDLSITGTGELKMVMMKLPTSLTHLSIQYFRELEILIVEVFQGVSALKFLYIRYCPKLKSLPEKDLLLSLLQLHVFYCPLLKQRSKKEKGEEWSKIAHIPCVQIL